MTLFLIYGSLAALALWATWHEDDLRWVGIALMLSFTVSNVVWYVGTPADRPGIYTMLEIFVAVMAFTAWGMTRHSALIGLVILNALSIVANIAFAMKLHPIREQINTYEQITNAIYVLECLVATGVGLRHGTGIGRFNHWTWRRDGVGTSDGVGQ